MRILLLFPLTPKLAAFVAVAIQLGCATTTTAQQYNAIHYVPNTNLCVSAPNTSTGSQLRLSTCNSNDDLQQWEYDSNDMFRLRANTSRCARRTGGTSSSIVLSNCNSGASDQRWDVNPDGQSLFIQASSNSNYCWESVSGSTSGSLLEVQNCATSNSDQRFDYGTYFDVVTRSNSDRCLSSPSSASTGNPLDLRTCNGDTLRMWRLDAETSLLRLKEDPRRCAAITSRSTGEPVTLVSCNDGDSFQRWEYTSSLELRSRNRNLCMQYNSVSTGQDILAYACDGGSDQEWRFVRGSDPDPDDDDYEPIRLRSNRSRCLGVDNTSTGTQVEVMNCDSGNDNRLWYLDGSRRLRLRANTNRCMTRDSSSSSSSNFVRLQTCRTRRDDIDQQWTYDINQKWTYNENLNYEFESETSGSSTLCMQYDSTSTGTSIISRTCDGGSDQEFDFRDTVNPSAEGKVIFPSNGNDCKKCIGVSSVSDGASLRWMDCNTSNDHLVRWIDYPDTTSGGGRWCLNDNNLCTVPNSNSPTRGTRLRLASVSSVTNSQSLLWFYNDSGNSVTDDITHWSSQSLCVGVASNGVDIEMQSCSSSQPRQSWDIVDYDDQEGVCDDLSGGGGGGGRDPSATSPGNLIYVKTDDDCYDCIAITGCPQSNYNCASARLAIANCFTADDFSYLKYWTQVPSPGGTQWCSRDSNFCVEYSTSAPGDMKLATSSGGQSLLWYTASIGGSGALEIQPAVSDGLCVASSGSAPLVESCASSSSNPKQWAIASFNEWSQTCDPQGRDPNSISGMFIHVNTDSDCGWCIGVDTRANPPVIGLAPCVDSNDNFETSFKTSMVPNQSTRWCLDSDSNTCIRYDTSANNDLKVVAHTGNQNELWYYEDNEITPLIRSDRCVVWDNSRRLYMDTCSRVASENRKWKIINANSYSCDTIGVSSFGAESKSGSVLERENGHTVTVIIALALSSLAFSVV